MVTSIESTKNSPRPSYSSEEMPASMINGENLKESNLSRPETPNLAAKSAENTTKIPRNTKKEESNPPLPSHANTIKNVLHNLNHQRKKRIFTDVIILVENEQFHLHKNLLAANSEYFTNLFSQQSLTNTPFYCLLNISKKSFQVVIDFIYTGGFTLNKENVMDVYTTSRVLGINHVFLCCQKVIKEIDASKLADPMVSSTINSGNSAGTTGPLERPKRTNSALTNSSNSNSASHHTMNGNGLANGNASSSLANLLKNPANAGVTGHQSASNLLNSALPLLANLNPFADAQNILNQLGLNAAPNPITSNLNQQNTETNHRNLLSLQNSLLPVEVQQVFLNQLASGKLNQNVSKSLRKDAAFLAKQLEEQVKMSNNNTASTASVKDVGNVDSGELKLDISMEADLSLPTLTTKPEEKEPIKCKIKLEPKTPTPNISDIFDSNLSLQDQLAQLAKTLAKQNVEEVNGSGANLGLEPNKKRKLNDE